MKYIVSSSVRFESKKVTLKKIRIGYLATVTAHSTHKQMKNSVARK